MTNLTTLAERIEGARLLPCPFCGGEFVELRIDCYVHCISCGADGPVSDHGDDKDGERAIALWNTRIATQGETT